VSCVPLKHRFPEPYEDTDHLLSWTGIAAAVRSHAHGLTSEEAEDLLGFADLLDGFAELEKRSTR
jgi:hypothetical protein